LKGTKREAYTEGMTSHVQRIIAAAFLMLPWTTAKAAEMVCIHPDRPNHTYRVADDVGVYTWDDHGIERSWALKCIRQSDGSDACHRWEQYGERGSSVMIFRMLPDGSLVEAGSWAILNTSRIRVTPGFVCTTRGE
jgi:hypothetical protein